MRKIFLLSLVSVVVFVACGASVDEHDPYRSKVGVADVQLTVESIAMLDALDLDSGATVDFSVSLARPDLGLQQPENDGKSVDDYIYTSDLPLGLQPRLMYVSDVEDEARDSGRMCQRSVFPHKCSVEISSDDYKKGERTYLVKILFEDDSYVAEEISVAFPDRLLQPEVLEPAGVPKQESTFKMSFTDVGADSYRVTMDLCHPYEDDGINPCLDGVEYSLEMQGGMLVDATDDSLYPLVMEQKDDLIQISSEFPLYFSESVVYTVTAEKGGDEDGVPTVTESRFMTSFEI